MPPGKHLPRRRAPVPQAQASAGVADSAGAADFPVAALGVAVEERFESFLFLHPEQSEGALRDRAW